MQSRETSQSGEGIVFTQFINKKTILWNDVLEIDLDSSVDVNFIIGKQTRDAIIFTLKDGKQDYVLKNKAYKNIDEFIAYLKTNFPEKIKDYREREQINIEKQEAFTKNKNVCMKYSIKVKVVFYNTDKGGRKNPVSSGYRTSILFGISKDYAFAVGRMSDYKALSNTIYNYILVQFKHGLI